VATPEELVVALPAATPATVKLTSLLPTPVVPLLSVATRSTEAAS
jgi:hypothetical protein